MKKNYFAVAIAAMIFTGCSNVELEDGNNVPEVAKLSFGSVVTADLVTRAVEAKALEANFMINLTADGATYNAVNKEEVTYSSPNYVINTDIYITKTGRTLTAWAPTSFVPGTEAGKENLFTLNAGVYSADKDFIYQKKDITSADCPVAIAMTHAMSKITFKFEYPDNHSPKNIKNFVVKGCAASNTLDILTGAWGTAVPAANIELIPAAGEDVNNGDQTKSVIVLPQASVTAGDLKIQLTADGTVSNEVDLAGITELKAATDYLVTISISDKKVSISGVEDKGWADGDGGKIEITQ